MPASSTDGAHREDIKVKQYKKGERTDDNDSHEDIQAPCRTLAHRHMTVVVTTLWRTYILKGTKYKTSDQRQPRAPTSARACNPIACHVAAPSSLTI
jgi:hypothetical protein